MNNILSTFADLAVEPSGTTISSNSEVIGLAMIIVVAICLISTITIEFLFSLAFGVRKKIYGLLS